MQKKSVIIANAAAVTVIAVVITVLALNGAGAMEASGKNYAVYRGSADNPYVSLMFNVYWGTEYIDGILEVLNAYDVKTTFFIGGSWAAKNNSAVKKIAAAGHEIGSHGYNHKDAEQLSYERNLDEMVPAEKLLEELTGQQISLFAPPSGSVGDAMFTAAEELGYSVIMWSRDTVDWRDKNPDLVFTRATSDIRNGELILMHPTAHTLEALPRILDCYTSSGFKAVPVGVNIGTA